MPISATCTACGKVIESIPDEYAGRSAKCPKCKGLILVPQPEKKPTSKPSKPRRSVRGIAVVYSICGFLTFVVAIVAISFFIAFGIISRGGGFEFTGLLMVAVGFFVSGVVLSGIASALRMLQDIYDEVVKD